MHQQPAPIFLNGSLYDVQVDYEEDGDIINDGEIDDYYDVQRIRQSKNRQRTMVSKRINYASAPQKDSIVAVKQDITSSPRVYSDYLSEKKASDEKLQRMVDDNYGADNNKIGNNKIGNNKIGNNKTGVHYNDGEFRIDESITLQPKVNEVTSEGDLNLMIKSGHNSGHLEDSRAPSVQKAIKNIANDAVKVTNMANVPDNKTGLQSASKTDVVASKGKSDKNHNNLGANKGSDLPSVVPSKESKQVQSQQVQSKQVPSKTQFGQPKVGDSINNSLKSKDRKTVSKTLEDVNSRIFMRPAHVGRFVLNTNNSINVYFDALDKEDVPIYSIGDGKVIYAGNDMKKYNNLVIIAHANQFVSTYANLSSVSVANNVTVKAGQEIGKISNKKSKKSKYSGNSLLFSIRKNNAITDPSVFYGDL